mgnify:CR=1 FL=1
MKGREKREEKVGGESRWREEVDSGGKLFNFHSKPQAQAHAELRPARFVGDPRDKERVCKVSAFGLVARRQMRAGRGLMAIPYGACGRGREGEGER